MVTVNILDSSFGKVSKEDSEYRQGDTVVLSAEGDEGYYCNSLSINGEELEAATDGTFSFVAEETCYDVRAIFTAGIFNNNDKWMLDKQNEGIVSLPTGDSGGRLYFKKQFTDIDLTVTAKDDTSISGMGRTDVLFLFDNDTHISFGFVEKDGKIEIQSQNGDDDGKHDSAHAIYEKWYSWGELTEQEAEDYRNEGVKLRIQRYGTEMFLYIGDRKLEKTVNLRNNSIYPVDESMKTSVCIRHYGDKGVKIDIPFEVSDTSLFYSNEKTEKVDLADPFILDNTAVDGYYYMYGTKRTCYCYRSTNLMDWEALGDTIDKTVSEELGNVLFKDVYAPEVVYDEDEKTYYMFFSATPSNTKDVHYLMFVATSKSPEKGFKLVDFSNLDDRTENSEYFAKYLYFNPGKLAKFSKNGKNYPTNRATYIPTIDPHPYEDETGKYLFWVDQEGVDRICAVRMKNDNWLTPDWRTATVLTRAHKVSPDSEVDAKYDFQGSDGYYLNEAPTVIKHNGKYYLTYSAGRYGTASYRVIQVAADPHARWGPLGSYNKMTENEGAILLTSGRSYNSEITGTGHHSFITAGDKLYMVYHRHDEPYKDASNGGGSNRNIAIDEVKWITNSKGLEVMHVNGATCTLQPKLDAFSEYTNIADEAVVDTNSTDKLDLKYLTDGLLSINNMVLQDTDSSSGGIAGEIPYVVQQAGETKIKNTTTFTFNFDSARDVRGIMVYNSKKRDTIFENISKIELVYVENGEEKTRIIENLAFSSEYYTNTYVTLGAAAVTEFAPMNVKSVKITIDVPVGKEVGISEVRILGK